MWDRFTGVDHKMEINETANANISISTNVKSRKSSFGKRLRAAREVSKITQAELASALNVSQQTIASWEANRTEPNISFIRSLSNFFVLSIDSLLTEDVETIRSKAKKAAPILALSGGVTNEKLVMKILERNVKQMTDNQLDRMLGILRLTFDDLDWEKKY